MTDAWQLFEEWSGTLAAVGGAAGLLGWDRETGMPPGGSETRARQLGTLATIHHRELVRPDLDGPLAELEAHDGLPPERARQVELMLRARRRAQRMPVSLVRDLSEATSRCVGMWIELRPTGDFAAFAEPFRRVVELKRLQARTVADGVEPYDALLDDYEPGARAAELVPVFADLRERLTPLVEIGASRPRPPLPRRQWPAEAQVALARDLAEMVGYDLSGGAVALSAHPFTSSPGYGDVRFTTRVDEANPVGSIMAVLHEAGHAMYEQGFPAAYARTALLDAPSMGAHESQSRFWENHVGRTRAFWERITPLLHGRFPDAMRGLETAALHREATAVEPSYIRVEADEVTYNLHIALRFELELALMRGDLEVGDLPGEWNTRMREFLGVTPPDDGAGVMQDIHWPEGLFGYFPTYTLGNLYAAQLAEAADTHLGGLDAAVADGRFPEILGFMRDRVHHSGNLLPTGELMRAATGTPLSADALVAHLRGVATG
ncbi:MAG: carboxypeptidase M32 [Thermoleophilia bacterium]|nr:carboxypeptidase M32 [Thermoleophilia bacterium]